MWDSHLSLLKKTLAVPTSSWVCDSASTNCFKMRFSFVSDVYQQAQLVWVSFRAHGSIWSCIFSVSLEEVISGVSHEAILSWYPLLYLLIFSPWTCYIQEIYIFRSGDLPFSLLLKFPFIFLNSIRGFFISRTCCVFLCLFVSFNDFCFLIFSFLSCIASLFIELSVVSWNSPKFLHYFEFFVRQLRGCHFLVVISWIISVLFDSILFPVLIFDRFLCMN